MAAQQVQYDHIEHIVRTTTQWNDAAIANFAIPRGVLCVEVLNNGTMKLKVGDGKKFYHQLPYIGGDGGDLSNYYTKEEVDRIITNLKAVTIPTTRIYPNKESLPIVGNKLGEIRFVNNPGHDPYTYMWNDVKWIAIGGAFDIDLSEYVKRAEIMPTINRLVAASHTHSNKQILDQTTAPYTIEDNIKLASLKNYDDTSIKERLTVVESEAHTHANMDILNATTANYTTAEKTKLASLENYAPFIGTTGTADGTSGLVPGPLTTDVNKFLASDGTWKIVAAGGIEPATTQTLGGIIVGNNLSIDTNGVLSTHAPYSLPTASLNTLGGIKVGTNLSIDENGVLSSTDTIYTLPIANASTLGGVKIGSNISIDANGVISTHAPYTLPIASDVTLGGIKVGSGLSINASGVLSATGSTYVLPIASANTLGGIKVGSNLSIDENGVLSADAQQYVLPIASANDLGGIKVGTNLSIDANGVLSATDTVYTLPVADANTLGGVKIGSNISIDANGVISTHAPYVLPTASDTTLGGIKVGANLTISDGVLSTHAPYVLPVADASTLGGIKVGANLTITDGVLSTHAPYTLPIASSNDLGGIKVGTGLSIDANGVLSASGSSYVLPVADASTLGGVKIGSNISIDSNGVISTHAPYTLPIAGASTLGGIKVGAGLSIDQDGILSTTSYTAGTGIDFIQTSQPSVITTDISDENWQNFAKYGNDGRDGTWDNKTYSLMRLHIDPGTQFRLKFISSGADTIYFNAAAFVNDTATSGGVKIIPADSSDWATDQSIWYTMPDGRESLDISIRLNNPNYGSGTVVSASSFYSMELEEKTNASGSYSINVVPATTTTLGGIIVGNNLSIDANGVLSATGGGSPYVLPVADASTLGGVKIGSNISIDSNGVISTHAPYTLPIADASTLGGIKVGTGLSIDANGVLSASGSSYVLPVADASTLGGVKIGSNISIDSNGVISTHAPYSLPTASSNTLGGIKVGTNLSIDANGVLSATDTVYTLPIADASTLGGVKIGSNISIDANGVISTHAPYTLPMASANDLGGIKVGTGLSIDANGVLSATGGGSYTLPPATDTTLGGIIVGAGLTIDQDGVLDATAGYAYTEGDGIVFTTVAPVIVNTDLSNADWRNYVVYSGGSRGGMSNDKTFMLMYQPMVAGTEFRVSLTLANPSDTVYYNIYAFQGTATSGGVRVWPLEGDWSTDLSVWFTMPEGYSTYDMTIRLNNPGWNAGSVVNASSFTARVQQTRYLPSGDKFINVKPATTSAIGGIIVGNSLSIDQNGVLDVNSTQPLLYEASSASTSSTMQCYIADLFENWKLVYVCIQDMTFGSSDASNINFLVPLDYVKTYSDYNTAISSSNPGYYVGEGYNPSNTGVSSATRMLVQWLDDDTIVFTHGSGNQLGIIRIYGIY